MSSMVESIEKEMKRRAYEAAMAILQSYQGQVHEAMEEFQGGIRGFYRANDEYIPYWQREAREADEWVYADVRQIEMRIEATADEWVDEISREIARLRRMIEEL
ncbi:DUF5082 domain-containing protein [Geobacillus sp. FSL W8-0032]|uniref:DUF5082 domain-containing protein n=1 Tax=Geobacillus icigianus TaxID=1430331 RepID=A0ABU6BGR4_9BACL|nr:hypothetical protein [Geobacillus icigianus]MEB3751156.1 hypothetical protein [Geobacillus icigianus]